MLSRFAALIAAAWAGVLVCIGAIAAPSAFSVLPAADAGRVAGRMFEQEAYLGIGLALVLIFIERRRSADAADAGEAGSGARAMSPNILLLLGTLFCTVAGYFAVLPMMAAARAGQGTLSFAALHAVSGGMFVLKGLLVLALAWRLTRLRTAATPS